MILSILMKIGYIGLGRMGKNMVLHLLEQGIEVVAWNRSLGPREEVAKAGATAVETVEEVIQKLNPPRIIWLMLPAGETTDEFINKVLPLLESNDLLIDGANSFYKDTLRRAEKIHAKGVHFLDIGVSGGPNGARTGACLMIGGAKEDLERVKELVEKASAPNAWGYFGGVGAGHFAKMVHNGIEYGMMESIAEGAAILKASEFNFDLAEVFRVYQQRSVIESRLVGWSEEALSEDPNLDNYSSVIGHTGEGEWTVKTAQKLGVKTPVLEDSLSVRVESEKDTEDSPNGFRNKLVSAMRGKFGDHKVRKN
ncbi:decarboxylating 6-phosphogluconate dehydrogenase [Candidatus Daviesbacteria bacterium]|nr:decarboxylating 6-phosphogluconate dehydrogenase [Candidatus Daviesbacteria bacterium]